jgi:hypothetical protein
LTYAFGFVLENVGQEACPMFAKAIANSFWTDAVSNKDT